MSGAVELRAAAAPYQHVRSIGEDVSAAELLLPAGHRLRPVDVAAAGAAGATELVVRRRPVVTVIPTGDEIRPVGSELGEGELPDTNSVMLAAQAEAAGCEAHRFEVAPDVPDEIAAAVRAAAARSDLVVVIAGSSAGRDDHTAAVVAEVGTLAVHGVAVRPGHPVVLGVVEGDPGAAGHEGVRPTPVLGAPGYPVSASLTFDIFAAPLLARLEGAPPPESPGRAGATRPQAGLDHGHGRLGPRPARPGRRAARGHAAPARRRRAHLARARRRAARGSRGARGPPRRRGGVRCACCGASARSSARSWPRARTTSCSTWPPPPCASAIRASRSRRRTSARSAGLTALRDGLCHVAGSHLLDPESGEYTLPYLERLLPGREVSVVRLVHREQGLIVAPGNPTGTTGIEDVAERGLRYVNRQRGAGTRVLLDHELARRGISPEAIVGYEREEHTHLAVAAAVAAGRADCGLGVLAAARAFGLDFVPVAKEPYDLVFEPDPILDPLWALLESEDFRRAVTDLGGYDTTEMGRRIR